MILAWTPKAWAHYLYWQENDPKLLTRINSLLAECLRTPFEGRGKPERLLGNLRGHVSRRINEEHRLVYRVQSEMLLIVQCRFHYGE